MTYIDAVVMPVPADRRADLVRFARETGAVFREHGALRVVDCWGDDVPDGKLTSFPLAVQLRPGESVVVGWVEWPSREVRDAAWPKVMADARMAAGPGQVTDGKRMIYGGFSVVADL